ncbi:FliM/FliN family flagellar motor C-terminal domain-containing protein [Sandaracinobacteroides sp. A072]|uniref:FliM/FliN family flagellar motor C-terminal domain-containing protein n=1 Tax=Sandaracinobacteroides sp. A072 TaxID=3461146 RepID=UPI0040413FC1
MMGTPHAAPVETAGPGRALSWPQAMPAGDTPEGAASAPPIAAGGPDLPGFAATLGPELGRLFGCRITARRLSGPEDSGTGPALPRGCMSLASLDPLDGAPRLHLATDGPGASLFLEQLFGARKPGLVAAGKDADAEPAGTPSALPPILAALPPGSASWMSLCGLAAEAAGRALAAHGQPAGAVRIAARAAAPDARLSIVACLALDLDGQAARLWLLRDPPPVTPAPAHDVAAWRSRAVARALEIDLPVALRLAETRVPVSELAALRPGDILPLARPKQLGVMVAGRCIAGIPADELAARTGSEKGTARREEDR